MILNLSNTQTFSLPKSDAQKEELTLLLKNGLLRNIGIPQYPETQRQQIPKADPNSIQAIEKSQKFRYASPRKKLLYRRHPYLIKANAPTSTKSQIEEQIGTSRLPGQQTPITDPNSMHTTEKSQTFKCASLKKKLSPQHCPHQIPAETSTSTHLGIRAKFPKLTIQDILILRHAFNSPQGPEHELMRVLAEKYNPIQMAELKEKEGKKIAGIVNSTLTDTNYKSSTMPTKVFNKKPKRKRSNNRWKAIQTRSMSKENQNKTANSSLENSACKYQRHSESSSSRCFTSEQGSHSTSGSSYTRNLSVSELSNASDNVFEDTLSPRNSPDTTNSLFVNTHHKPLDTPEENYKQADKNITTSTESKKLSEDNSDEFVLTSGLYIALESSRSLRNTDERKYQHAQQRAVRMKHLKQHQQNGFRQLKKSNDA